MSFNNINNINNNNIINNGFQNDNGNQNDDLPEDQSLICKDRIQRAAGHGGKAGWLSHPLSLVDYAGNSDANQKALDVVVVRLDNEELDRGFLLGNGSFKTVFSLLYPDQSESDFVEANTDLTILDEHLQQQQLNEIVMQAYLQKNCNTDCLVTTQAVAIEKQRIGDLVLRQIFTRMECDLYEAVFEADLTDAEKVAVLVRVASGIEAMHDLDVIHEDIKLENILINDRNEAFITDFGFAKTVSKFLRSDEVCGSPHYVSPDKLNDIAKNLYKDTLNPAHATPEKCIQAWTIALARRETVLESLRDLHNEFQKLVPEGGLDQYQGDLEKLAKRMDKIARKRGKLNTELEKIQSRIGQVALTAAKVEEKNRQIKHMVKGVDVWSVGVMIYAIVVGAFPRFIPDTSDAQKVINAIGHLNQYAVDYDIKHAAKRVFNPVDLSLLDIASLCMTVDPFRRPSMKEVREYLEKIEVL